MLKQRPFREKAAAEIAAIEQFKKSFDGQYITLKADDKNARRIIEEADELEKKLANTQKVYDIFRAKFGGKTPLRYITNYLSGDCCTVILPIVRSGADYHFVETLLLNHFKESLGVKESSFTNGFRGIISCSAEPQKVASARNIETASGKRLAGLGVSLKEISVRY